MWGGILEDLLIDLTQHTAVLKVRVSGHEAQQDFTIRCSGVSEFILTADILEPWDYGGRNCAWYVP